LNIHRGELAALSRPGEGGEIAINLVSPNSPRSTSRRGHRFSSGGRASNA
jgi:hypothetical protein